MGLFNLGRRKGSNKTTPTNDAKDAKKQMKARHKEITRLVKQSSKEYPLVHKLQLPEIVPSAVLDDLKEAAAKKSGLVRKVPTGYLVLMFTEADMEKADLRPNMGDNTDFGQLSNSFRGNLVHSATLAANIAQGQVAIIPDKTTLEALAEYDAFNPECAKGDHLITLHFGIFPQDADDDDVHAAVKELSSTIKAGAWNDVIKGLKALKFNKDTQQVQLVEAVHGQPLTSQAPSSTAKASTSQATANQSMAPAMGATLSPEEMNKTLGLPANTPAETPDTSKPGADGGKMVAPMVTPASTLQDSGLANDMSLDMPSTQASSQAPQSKASAKSKSTKSTTTAMNQKVTPVDPNVLLDQALGSGATVAPKMTATVKPRTPAKTVAKPQKAVTKSQTTLKRSHAVTKPQTPLAEYQNYLNHILLTNSKDSEFGITMNMSRIKDFVATMSPQLLPIDENVDPDDALAHYANEFKRNANGRILNQYKHNVQKLLNQYSDRQYAVMHLLHDKLSLGEDQSNIYAQKMRKAKKEYEKGLADIKEIVQDQQDQVEHDYEAKKERSLQLRREQLDQQYEREHHPELLRDKQLIEDQLRGSLTAQYRHELDEIKQERNEAAQRTYRQLEDKIYQETVQKAQQMNASQLELFRALQENCNDLVSEHYDENVQQMKDKAAIHNYKDRIQDLEEQVSLEKQQAQNKAQTLQDEKDQAVKSLQAQLDQERANHNDERRMWQNQTEEKLNAMRTQDENQIQDLQRKLADSQDKLGHAHEAQQLALDKQASDFKLKESTLKEQQVQQIEKQQQQHQAELLAMQKQKHLSSWKKALLYCGLFIVGGAAGAGGTSVLMDHNVQQDATSTHATSQSSSLKSSSVVLSSKKDDHAKSSSVKPSSQVTSQSAQHSGNAQHESSNVTAKHS